MAPRFDIKTKTFFSIPPKLVRDKTPFSCTDNRVVFIDQGFDLDDIRLITECVQVWELWYQFSVHTGYADDKKLEFNFKKKADCIMAQRELSRAWARVGEFVYADEDVPTTESSDPT